MSRATPVGVGEQAPDFVRADHHGTQVRLRDVWSASTVVLVFYPFAFTGVCTGELRALAGALPRFEVAEARVLAVSCDSMFTLRAFADQEGLAFPLVSDFWPHGEVARSYGVFDEERGCARRGTFVIDRSGVVRWSVVNDIFDARDVDDYLEAVERLRT
ncbi:peroxiredoxin [Thermasporomyces composti]|uniref:Alkyl hydroperoxide reductase E n=1 Tax=Thermasporomyces composti TaxID=696763 RepID=A0A3D9V844_THECX|nr:peroxiredoxin [Thermasporomyces composti]